MTNASNNVDALISIIEQENVEEAIRRFEQHLEQSKDLNGLLKAVCVFFAKTDAQPESIELLSKLVSRFSLTMGQVKSTIQQVCSSESDLFKAQSFALLAQFDSSCAISSFNAGYFYKIAHQYEFAAMCYANALSRNIDRPEEVYLNLATIQAEHLQQPDKAISSLETALKLSSNYVPALKNLANLYEQRGDQDNAITLLNSALEIEPYDYSVLARLVETTKYTSVEDSPLAKIKHLLSLSGLPLEAKIDLNYAAAKICNDCHDYDDAFEFYRLANQANKMQAGTYQKMQVVRYTNACINSFTKQSTSIEAITSPTNSAPIFIVGMFRSGSTLIEQILGAHSSVIAAGELPFLNEIVTQLGESYPSGLKTLSSEKRKVLASQYFERLTDNNLVKSHGAKFITDKCPDNFLHVGLIKTLFPDAKIINTARNPIDNCWSIFNLRLSDSLNYANDLSDISHYYRNYQTLTDHWKSVYPESIYTLNYDELVQNPEPQIKQLLAFLNLEWEDQCVDFYKLKNQVRTASIYQVRQPLYKSSSGRWRHYEKHLAQLVEEFQ